MRFIFNIFSKTFCDKQFSLYFCKANVCKLIVTRNITLILAFVISLCSACDFRLKANEDGGNPSSMKVERYDRLESRYVITGDFSALQQMNTEFPIETRTLVEKMLHIGDVSDHDISERFLRFYQDSALQVLVNDVEAEYANMDDINQGLRRAFGNLKDWLPGLPIPRVYAQIGALDQSVVVGEMAIGISLDKYMGAKYPLYKQFGYSNEQLATMGRGYIVPDCVSFYLLSLYPMSNYDSRTQQEKDLHMGKVMWIVNKALEQDVFDTDFTRIVSKYMRQHPEVSYEELLTSDNYNKMK